MALRFNGTNILDVRFNGTQVNRVRFNGTERWRRFEWRNVANGQLVTGRPTRVIGLARITRTWARECTSIYIGTHDQHVDITIHPPGIGRVFYGNNPKKLGIPAVVFWISVGQNGTLNITPDRFDIAPDGESGYIIRGISLNVSQIQQYF